MAATSERSLRRSEFEVSISTASPSTALPCSSCGAISHNDDHEPTSLQPTSRGSMAAAFVFSITA